ncbi:DUF3352 domain-containing protein [Synechococcus sp. M16CYN]
MKARSFFAAVGAVLLSLVLLAIGLVWAIDRRSPLHLAQQTLQLPRSARFVPRDAAISLCWLADPSRLPAYAQAVAPATGRRAARDGARTWRNGAFALAGLDFEAELLPWIGSEISFTLLESGSEPGWILALTSRDNDGARRFLQRFWQTRSLAGTDLQVSSYRGIGVISGRGALIGRNPQPLATALIDDDLLLLASGRGVLEQSLDVSQLDAQHQLGDQRLQQNVADFSNGVALLTASPPAMQRWLQLPAALVNRDDLVGLLASLRLEGTELVVDALLKFRDSLKSEAWPSITDLSATAGGRALWLAQLQNPARLLDPDEQHPIAQWLGPLLRDYLRGQFAAAAIAELNDGPLLWQHQSDGWLLGTHREHPSQVAVDSRLRKFGLSRSELQGEGETLEVWTRLARQRNRNAGLEVQLAVAQARASSLDWWGETLMALTHRQDVRGLRPRLLQWQAISTKMNPVQALLLADEPSQNLLDQWQPWILIQALAGQSLKDHVRELSLAVDADKKDDVGAILPFHARLRLG